MFHYQRLYCNVWYQSWLRQRLLGSIIYNGPNPNGIWHILSCKSTNTCVILTPYYLLTNKTKYSKKIINMIIVCVVTRGSLLFIVHDTVDDSREMSSQTLRYCYYCISLKWKILQSTWQQEKLDCVKIITLKTILYSNRCCCI